MNILYWLTNDVDAQRALDALGRLGEVKPGNKWLFVGGWEYRQICEQLGGDYVVWISRDARLGDPDAVYRRGGQVSAELDVSVWAAGMRNRSIGLFAETLFTTENEYIEFKQLMIIGKINPDGRAETPYPSLSDDYEDRRVKYGGTRPPDGMLFHANSLGNFVLGTV